ncbi:MAG: ABC transporter ATP-binding protein [Azospirillaceae bacterium]|nr:ABC transporter ATP-binding protein [Azospirillaceae bacterium]
MVAPLIELQSVSKCFRAQRTRQETWAIRDVSLNIGEGEFLCLLGPSGCGKSTILDMLAGFEGPTEGRILIAGEPVGRPGPDRGVVFQDASLFPWLSVIDNVTFAPRLSGVAPSTYRAQALELIEKMGLGGFENHAPYELSGGMRQRVAIARAWISNPRILLMDEPFGALDAQTRLEMQETLLAARGQAVSTVLFVTHDIEEALFLADRVAVMSRRPGRITLDIPIPFPRPRCYEALIADPAFSRLKQDIVRILRQEIVARRETDRA